MFPTFFFITTDESQYILPVTDYLMKKYSNNNINICYLGYTNPNYTLSEKSKFIELLNGNPRNKNKWFLDLYNYFNSIDDEYVVFTVDDNPLKDYLNFEHFEYAMEYLKNNKDIGILYTYSNHIGEKIFENEKYSIHNIPQNFCHTTNTQMNIWKRTTLLNVLSSNFNNIFDFELQGHRYLHNERVVVYYAKSQYLFSSCMWSLCSESRNKGYIWALPILKEDLEYFIKNNIIDKNNINYNGCHSHVFPYDYFNGDFSFSKMRQYAYERGWDNIDNGYGYSISHFEKIFPHYK
jgi:hypothetical protein